MIISMCEYRIRELTGILFSSVYSEISRTPYVVLWTMRYWFIHGVLYAAQIERSMKSSNHSASMSFDDMLSRDSALRTATTKEILKN